MKRVRMHRSAMATMALLGLVVASPTGCGSPASSAPAPRAAQADQAIESDSIGTYAASEASEAGFTLGVITDQTGRVVDVEAGSAAQQAGVQKGDVLIALDDVPVAPALDAASAGGEVRIDHAQLHSLQNKIAAGKAMNVMVQRDGQQVNLDITPARRQGQPDQPTPTAVPPDHLYM